jgi:hypothetical protein
MLGRVRGGAVLVVVLEVGYLEEIEKEARGVESKS